jgi:hypothetical protein
MDDFNEPFNKSITDYALATTSMLKVKLSREKVKLSREKVKLYNLMLPTIARGIADFYYEYFLNLLDQFMV